MCIALMTNVKNDLINRTAEYFMNCNGRKEQFCTLRTENGISGFTRPNEKMCIRDRETAR